MEFITTDLAHGDCTECATCAERARVMARVTGSIGATEERDNTRVGGLLHFATVRRADHVEED
jgi:thymidine kinase